MDSLITNSEKTIEQKKYEIKVAKEALRILKDYSFNCDELSALLNIAGTTTVNINWEKIK